MESGLEGKVAVVSGGSSHIGRAIVFGLAREGADVVIASLDEQRAHRVAAEANELNGGGRTVAVVTDATKVESAFTAVKRVLSDFGQIDVVVNNIGWDQGLNAFVETDLEFWEKIISLNYKTALILTRAVLPHMIERRHGRVIFIGSDAGRVGEGGEAVYSGTKGAIIAFSKAIARETGRYGITSNVVCPGLVVPELREHIGPHSLWQGQLESYLDPELQAKYVRSIPMKRLGKPQEIADAVVFLASERASYITGQTISVSGGSTMV